MERPHTVLLVEDDRELRSLFALLMELQGLSVIQAERGDEAVETLREQADRIGVVVADFGVPVLSGQELLRSIRAARPAIRLLCTSGRGDEQTRQDALAAGADDFVPKPFQPPEMIARIKACLESA